MSYAQKKKAIKQFDPLIVLTSVEQATAKSDIKFLETF